MFYPTAMIMADRSTRQHVLSARPDAPTLPWRSPQRHGDSMRRLSVVTLRRLADHLDRQRATTPAPAS